MNDAKIFKKRKPNGSKKEYQKSGRVAAKMYGGIRFQV